MPRFDEELRATLRGRAGRIDPRTDPIPGIERRAKRIRRVRNTATTGAALGVVIAVAAAPLLYRQLRGPAVQQHNHPAAVGSTTAGTVEGTGTSTGPGAAGIEPSNKLTWPARGTLPPRAFNTAVASWYATDARGHHGSASRLHRDRLWSGALPDGRWTTLDQVWNPTDSRRAHGWSTVLIVGRPDGTQLTVPYDLPTRFRHQAKGVPDSSTGTRAIAGYGFGLKDCVLVIGSPAASRGTLTGTGGTSSRPLHDGAAIFRHPSGAEAYRLSDASGKNLTPDDRHHGSAHGWHLDLVD